MFMCLNLHKLVMSFAKESIWNILGSHTCQYIEKGIPVSLILTAYINMVLFFHQPYQNIPLLDDSSSTKRINDLSLNLKSFRP